MQVFTTLSAASDYRELITQQLKASMSDMITMEDRGRISAKGITSGSNFKARPPRLSPGPPASHISRFTHQYVHTP